MNFQISKKNKYQSSEINLVIDALKNHNSSTSLATEFESQFAKRIGIKYAIACNSGTSGLHAALYAAGVGPGDEVIVPALTVIMDAFAVIHMGAIPIFADIDEDTHLISVQDIKRKITNKTKAIIAVSWEGISCDMDAIMQIAHENSIIVIDDSARAILNTYKGRLSGNNAHISVFSFEAKKHITTGGEGGMIVTNDHLLAEKSRKFAGIGYKHLTAEAGKTHLAQADIQRPDYKRYDVIGLNYRMNEVSAAIGLGQLKRIDEIVGKRIYIGKLYDQIFGSFNMFKPQSIPKDCTHSYYTYSVDYLGSKDNGISWVEVYNAVKAKGGDGFYGVVSIPYLEPALKGMQFGDYILQDGLCPIAESLQKRVMCFKTNYREINEAKDKLKILENTLKTLF